MSTYTRTHATEADPLIHGENMIDGLTASSILRLPYFWFRNPTQRRIHRIPHYCFYRFVRFRPSEITHWAQEYRNGNIKVDPEDSGGSDA